MLTGQLAATMSYVAILILALLTPYLASKGPEGFTDRSVLVGTLGAAVLVTVARHGSFQVLGIILLLPVLGLGLRALLGGVAAILLFWPAVWWAPEARITPVTALLFILLGSIAWLPRLGKATAPEGSPAKLSVAMIIALLIGLGIGLFTAPFGSREPMYFAWHHWGAYLSPVHAWLAGGLPYRDFPIQYGLGPTAILATVCRSQCWSGMYAATITANALYFAILAGCIIVVTASCARALRWLALAALLCACFVWTAFPAELGSTAMTPSVAGLRFLPIAVLLFHIAFAEANDRRRDWLGHAIWLVDLFWSPEGAFFGTLIWWPYLAMRGAANATSPRERWIQLLRGALRGLIALVAGMFVLALVLLLLSDGAARPADFFAYILHPPGRLPLNLLGAVWLALASILVALQPLATSERSPQRRILYASLLSLLGAGTYFLSRSHDNNILNLFPLLVVLLAASAVADGPTDAPPLFRNGFVRTVLSAMVAFTAMAGSAAWKDGAANDGLLNVGAAKLISRLTPTEGTKPSILPQDALRGLAYLRNRDAGAVVLIDQYRLIPLHQSDMAWTGVNDVANFEPLPRSIIVRYVCRGAVAYRRPGWILVDWRNYGDWLSIFGAAYEVREQADFGSYRAYHLFPRGGPLGCAEL